MSYMRQPYAAAPAGWAPIPYQGAAPPIPAGYVINQQQWAMGQWQPNPHYNPVRFPAPAVPWMASQSWQQQQPNFNPYKKVIKPPSAEYMAMPLSNNPLGLHDLVEACVLYIRRFLPLISLSERTAIRNIPLHRPPGFGTQ